MWDGVGWCGMEWDEAGCCGMGSCRSVCPRVRVQEQVKGRVPFPGNGWEGAVLLSRIGVLCGCSPVRLCSVEPLEQQGGEQGLSVTAKAWDITGVDC